MEKINVEFLYTETEAVRSVLELTLSVNKGIVTLSWIGGLFIAATFVFSFTGDQNIFDHTTLLVLGVFLLSTRWLAHWTARRDFRKNPTANKTIRWQIDDEWLKNETDGAEAKFTWENLLRVEERKPGFLVFPQPRLAHWIPKSAFKDGRDLDVFRKMVQKHGIELKA